MQLLPASIYHLKQIDYRESSGACAGGPSSQARLICLATLRRSTAGHVRDAGPLKDLAGFENRIFNPTPTSTNSTAGDNLRQLRSTMSNTPRTPPTALGYRLAKTDEDLEILKQLRTECGWGMAKLVDNWGSPDRKLCIFTREVGEPGSGEVETVGMGGWVFELPDDPEAASRSTHTVELGTFRPCGCDTSQRADMRPQCSCSFGRSSRVSGTARQRWT